MKSSLFDTDETSPKIKAIDELNEAGYCLIPLNGKIPTLTNWVQTVAGTYHHGNLSAINYGVALRACDLVLDVDPRNFDKDDSPLARLVAKIGPLSTFTIRTGGGGLHIYLRKPEGLAVVNDLKDYKGIEIKSLGRQVVGPGSIHPDTGNTYEIVAGSPLVIMDAPKALLEICKRTAPVFDITGPGLKEYKNDATTQKRYVDYLKTTAEPSVSGKNGDNNAFKVAAHGRDLALPPINTWELMLAHWNPRCKPPWESEELKSKVIHAYKYAKSPLGGSHPTADFSDVIKAKPEDKQKTEDEISWITNKNGTPKVCFHNLMNFLKSPAYGLQKTFGYNQFTGLVEFMVPAPWHRGRMPSSKEMSDADLKLLKGYLTTRAGYEASVSNIEEAVCNVAHNNHFHPVREYLENLNWDGKPRLDMWLHDYLGVEDSDYSRACARKTLCAGVMRVMRPGVKFDHVLVLEGGQDIGKSTVCEILGGEFFTDFTLDPHNKDTIQYMQGQWIIELAELEATRRADTDALKAFLTRTVDRTRVAFGRLAANFPRQCIFIATKNPGVDGTYLKDETGNRRWWPVLCEPEGGQVDFKAFKAVRNQLWAEAMYVVSKVGELLFMDTKKLKSAAKIVVAKRRAMPAWTERISAYVFSLSPEEKQFITARQIFMFAMGGSDIALSQRYARDIAEVMRTIGYISKVKWIRHEDGQERGVRGYMPALTVEAPEKPEAGGIFAGLI